VELLQPGARSTRTVITLFPVRLAPELQEWWYSKLPATMEMSTLEQITLEPATRGLARQS
jgi:hypothetical protein